MKTAARAELSENKKSDKVEAEKKTILDPSQVWEFEQYRKEWLKAQGVIE